MTYDPALLSVHYRDYPASQRGWYIIAECYDEIHDGPFYTMQEAEKALHDYAEQTYEPPDTSVWANAETPFTENH